MLVHASSLSARTGGTQQISTRSTCQHEVCAKASRPSFVAFETALEWLSQELKNRTLTEQKIRICTDSLSLVTALLSGQQRRTDATSKHVRQMIEQLFPASGCHLTV